MKILLVSDTHGNNEVLDQIVLKHQNMDFYLHLGDSEADEYSIRPFVSVRGNNDYYGDFNQFIVLPTPLGNIFACHYNNISVSELKAHDTKFFIHGHTHVRRHEISGEIIKICPGAISYPRDSHYLSYAILEISKDSYELNFFSLE